MTDKKDFSFEKLTDKLFALPEEYKKAFIMLITHFDFIYEMCAIEPLTDKQRASLTQTATKSNDILALLILKMEFYINSDSKT